MKKVSKGKILVVDDSSAALKMARLALEDAGYEIITKQEAVLVSSIILREKPHLVLLDVTMPAVSGDKLVEIIRGHPACARTALLLYSVKPPAELEALAHRCGADGFIQKGPDTSLLVQQVNLWMGRLDERAEQPPDDANG